MKLIGKYTEADILASTIEQEVISQTYDLINHPMFRNQSVKIMADCHAGRGCVVGLTTTSANIIIPNLIGVDIGCGMSFVNLGNIDINLESLDNYIRKNIPSGAEVNSNPALKFIGKEMRKKVNYISEKTKTDYSRHIRSLGSLGGGNHFIEVSQGINGEKWLIVHSGSRNFGLQVAKYHQKKTEKYCDEIRKEIKENKNRFIKNSIANNLDMNSDEIKKSIKNFDEKMELYKVPKDLSFLENQGTEGYINDMLIAQEFASLNRFIMIKKICSHLKITAKIQETIHNYYQDGMIRKGAISAQKDELVLIPINMRDGSLLAIGKGNPDYNFSAPHGAGRIMSRSKAKQEIKLKDYIETMKDVYSTSVRESTLDEAPMAYKTIDEIIENTRETIEIIDRLKPIYNFKA